MPTVVRQLVPFATLLVLAGLVALASLWAALALLVGVAVGVTLRYRRMLRSRHVLAGILVVAAAAASLTALVLVDKKAGHPTSGGGFAPVLPTIQAVYFAEATYDPSKLSWRVIDRFDVPTKVFRQYTFRARDIRYLLIHSMHATGWTDRIRGTTIEFQHGGAQAVRPPEWRLLKTLKLHLRTAAPYTDAPALIPGPGSTVVLRAPRRMIRATFPPFTRRTDMLNGQDEIRVPLEVSWDEPQTVLRLQTTSRFGRSGIGSQTLDLIEASWFKWLLGVCGFVRGLLWKRLRLLLRSFRTRAREQHAEAPRPAG